MIITVSTVSYSVSHQLVGNELADFTSALTDFHERNKTLQENPIYWPKKDFTLRMDKLEPPMVDATHEVNQAIRDDDDSFRASSVTPRLFMDAILMWRTIRKFDGEAFISHSEISAADQKKAFDQRAAIHARIVSGKTTEQKSAQELKKLAVAADSHAEWLRRAELWKETHAALDAIV